MSRGRHAAVGVRLVIWVVAFLVLVAPTERATASVVVPMSLDELARHATDIVDAQVIAVHTTADSGRIERVVSLRVLDRWKGTSDAVVHVRLPGGTIGRTRTLVTGVPALDDGDRFVLFLDRGAWGAHRVLGLYQGAWRVSASPRDGSLLVGPVPAGQVVAGRVVRGDGTRRSRRLDVFRQDVHALLGQAP